MRKCFVVMRISLVTHTMTPVSAYERKEDAEEECRVRSIGDNLYGYSVETIEFKEKSIES